MNFKNNFSRSVILVVLSISFFLIFSFVTNKQDTLAVTKANKYNVEVFKTPSCGCCYGYVLFLEEEKFKVKQTDMRSLHAIKIKHNIPLEMQSCHTTILGKYFIEGHVPIEAINKLLKDEIDVSILSTPAS